MHLKQAILSTQNQDENIVSRLNVHHSNIIGSKHVKAINFNNDTQFFSGYVPSKSVLEAKKQAMDFKDADILELREKKRWNSSVVSPNKFDKFQEEESQKQKLLKIKLGLTEWAPVQFSPRKSYKGTQTRNDYAGWNVSTFVEKKQKSEGLYNSNIQAIDNSIKYNSQSLKKYKKLTKRYEEAQSSRKQEIRQNSHIIENIRNSYIFNFPNASPDKSKAASLRIYDELSREELKKSMNLSDTNDSMVKSFKAILSPTQKMNMKMKYFHSGNWGKNSPPKIKQKCTSDSEEEQQYTWSCCQNSDINSHGCSHRIVDKNKMNIESFNL